MRINPLAKALTAQYYYANLEDYYTQHFAGLTHIWAIDKSQSLKTDLRFFHTGSDGANGSFWRRLRAGHASRPQPTRYR
jgi:hypothetical protein